MSTPRAQTTSTPASFTANIATILGGQFANVAIALLAEICMARLLGPAARGQVSVCLMAVWFGATLGGLGGDIPIVLWSAAGKKFSHWSRAILLWGLAGCGAAEAIWWLLYSWLHASSLRDVTPGLAVAVLWCIPVAILFNYSIAWLTGCELFGQRAAVALLENFVSLLAMLALVWFYGRTGGAAMWGNWFGLAGGVIIAVFLAASTFRSDNYAVAIPSPELRSGLLVGLRGQLGNVASLFTYRLDVFIVNHFLDPAQVGIYAVGVAVSESLWQIPQAVSTALFPHTARTLDQDSAALTTLMVRNVVLISCLSAAVLALGAPLAIPLFFGGRFAAAVAVIWWLLPGIIALAVAKVAASALAGRQKTAYSSLSGMATLTVTVILDLLLIPRMGIRGAALASSVAYCVNGALLLAALRYEMKTNWSVLLLPSREDFSRYQRAGRDFLGRLRAARTAL